MNELSQVEARRGHEAKPQPANVDAVHDQQQHIHQAKHGYGGDEFLAQVQRAGGFPPEIGPAIISQK